MCRARGNCAGSLMDKISNGDFTRGNLLLKMAFEAEIRIAGREEFLIHAAMRIMAGSAPLAEGFVLKYKWSRCSVWHRRQVSFAEECDVKPPMMARPSWGL